MKTPSSPVDYRELMQRLESVVARIEGGRDSKPTVHAAADEIISQFREELGVYGGRLYRRDGDDYVLQATFPDARKVENGLRIPRSYPPIELCLMRGSVYMEPGDSLIDPQIESALGVNEFAAVEVGAEEYLLGFNIEPGHDRADILYSLGVVRHAVNQQLRRRRMEDALLQARQIHESILPRQAPPFESFDIAGRNESMESVGGDLFDYMRVSDKILGVVVADVSGHGLPAALQVRDIYIGMRMGNARDFKIVRTVERLNRIIHESTMTSRFVSMFYGELEANGTFIYVNAGHPPPFHLRADGGSADLTEGGPVLGPLPGASYDRGFVHMSPGDMLVMFTDGLTEAMGRPEPGQEEEEFGLERLMQAARALQGRSAQEVLDGIFEAVEEWSGRSRGRDDRTAVVIVYPAEVD